MARTFYKRREHVCHRPRLCTTCHKPIHRGQRYAYFVGRTEDGFAYLWTHLECCTYQTP